MTNLPILRIRVLRIILLVQIIFCSFSSAENFMGMRAPKTMITWVNGIGHNMDHMREGNEKLSEVFSHCPTYFCYNPTAQKTEDDTKGFIGDLTQCTQQKMLGKNTEEVDALVSHLKAAIEKVGPKGKVIHISHSQGAIITSLAVQRLTKDEMRQMEIICFGGGATLHVSEKYPFARCINYYSVNDPLLCVVPAAAKALRDGFMKPEFVFLAPRAGDVIIDHGLFNPTYLEALKWEGRRYRTLYLTPWYPLLRLSFIVSQQLCISFHEAFIRVLKMVMERTILKLVLSVQRANTWMMECIFKPIALILVILYKMLNDFMRRLRGEDFYEPVEVEAVAETVQKVITSTPAEQIEK